MYLSDGWLAHVNFRWNENEKKNDKSEKMANSDYQKQSIQFGIYPVTW